MHEIVAYVTPSHGLPVDIRPILKQAYIKTNMYNCVKFPGIPAGNLELPRFAGSPEREFPVALTIISMHYDSQFYVQIVNFSLPWQQGSVGGQFE